MKKIVILTVVVIFSLLVAGCLKPYHFNEEWWEEKVENREDDWGR